MNSATRGAAGPGGQLLHHVQAYLATRHGLVVGCSANDDLPDLVAASLVQRYADRAKPASLANEPPRYARRVPLFAPVGSVCGSDG